MKLPIRFINSWRDMIVRPEPTLVEVDVEADETPESRTERDSFDELYLDTIGGE